MAEREAAFSSYQPVSSRINFSKTCYRTATCWQSVSVDTISSHPMNGAQDGAQINEVDMSKLTDLKARSMKPGDKPITDGTVPGLRLHPGKVAGRGKWIMRFPSPTAGRTREFGLGVYPDVTLLEAREKAGDARKLIRDGIDPIEQRKVQASVAKSNADMLTFKKAAQQAHADRKDGWKNKKHAAQWIKTLETYVLPKIGDRKVDDLKVRDFADALRPIWLDMPETASRTRQRCDAVMEWCIAHELIGANPVKSVGSLLPKQPRKRERVTRFPALPWQDVPAFVTGTLHVESPSLSASMLFLLILTVSRSGEVRAMEWDEVDFDTATWTVPASRMKAGVEHRVPLSDRAVQILKEQEAKAEHPKLVFPTVRGKVATDMILTKFLRDKQVPSNVKGRTATAHGMRAAFRDWVSENGYSHEAAERALSHQIRNSTEWSYNRSDLLDQRRILMQAWSDFVCKAGPQSADILPIRKAV